MAYSFAYAFYHSRAWLDCREGYIQSVFGLCEHCGQPGYIVHHKVTLTPANINNPNVTLNWEMLEYLCLACHNIEHGVCKKNTYSITRDGLMFDSNGNLIKISDSPLK
jgi:5-methylcytosine-specific restriction endonuclease McrA